MNLTEYIYTRYNQDKRQALANATGETKFFNLIEVPSINQIAHYQKQVFKASRGITDEVNFQDPLLKALNNDLNKKILNGQNYFINVNNAIEKIEKSIEILNTKDINSMKLKAEKLGAMEKDIDSLITQFSQFFDALSKDSSLKDIYFAINIVQKKIKSIQQSICNIYDDNITPPPFDSFIKNITWCEYIIKGQYLESKGTEFFIEQLPRNFKVLNTGPLRGQYDILGNYQTGQKMKEDIMIFNNDNFQIEFTIGKNNEKQSKTLKEFIEFLDKQDSKETIRISQQSYDEMQKNLVSAIQAKATRSNRIKFGNININTAKINSKGLALQKLKSLYQKNNNQYKIISKHSDYNALFNYNLGVNINHLIGKNTLLLTRDGIKDLNTYILDLFNQGRYFYAIEDINLNSNKANKIGIDFKD